MVKTKIILKSVQKPFSDEISEVLNAIKGIKQIIGCCDIVKEQVKDCRRKFENTKLLILDSAEKI